jgi:molybdenum ABC transporter molybdate-binding protein
MFSRLHPAFLAFAASVLLLAGLIAALYWDPFAAEEATSAEPLLVYCAEALRVPMEATARDYQREVGQQVYVDFGPSQTMLAKLQLTKKGDLFLPADDCYLELARQQETIDPDAIFPLARMTAVAILKPSYTGPMNTWADFVATGHSIGLANADAAAVGNLLRQRLLALGLWDELAKRQPTFLGNVNEVANTGQIGALDVGIVWDAVAKQHERKGVKSVHLPELDSVTAKVQIAITKYSTQPEAARRFIRYLRGKTKGARYFKEQGYADFVEEEYADRAELVVYAGAMLRPAIEETITQFEKREGVRVTRVYNGCGILVSQMRTGQWPDVYFACDPRFMEEVQDHFEKAKTISSNQLVIAVRKGNPLGIKTLSDLGKPGIRIGVGHEQQCALGAITKETLVRVGAYKPVQKNVVLTSPTGDFLINQLRSGSKASHPDLDAPPRSSRSPSARAPRTPSCAGGFSKRWNRRNRKHASRNWGSNGSSKGEPSRVSGRVMDAHTRDQSAASPSAARAPGSDGTGPTRSTRLPRSAAGCGRRSCGRTPRPPGPRRRRSRDERAGRR